MIRTELLRTDIKIMIRLRIYTFIYHDTVLEIRFRLT